jgi:hypothetical protein
MPHAVHLLVAGLGVAQVDRERVRVVHRDKAIHARGAAAEQSAGRHRVERHQEGRNAPVILARRAVAIRAETRTRVGVDHERARRPIAHDVFGERAKRVIFGRSAPKCRKPPWDTSIRASSTWK